VNYRILTLPKDVTKEVDKTRSMQRPIILINPYTIVDYIYIYIYVWYIYTQVDKTRFMQRPIILINPSLEAIHCMATTTHKVVIERVLL